MSRIEKTYAYRAVQKAHAQGIMKPGEIISHIDGRNVSVSMIRLVHIRRAIEESE